MWDYSEKVMDHYRNPRNVGEIKDADAVGIAGSLNSGDQLKIYLKIKDNIVTDAKFQTFGCGSAVASSSILTEMIIGKTLDEVKKITNKDIADELGGLPPEKMHCSVMGYEAHIQKEKIICTCFQISENMIWDAIKQNNLKTVEEITNYTKAGGACGKCKEVIQDIINTYYNKEKSQNNILTPTQWILKVNNIIETQISPELQKDGGDIELVDVKDKAIYVKLKGRCSGCKNSTMTLKNFAEKILKDTLGSDITLVEVK